MPVKMICTSHTPLMDHVPAAPEIDAEVRANFRQLAEEVAAYDPELIIVFAPDHIKGVFYDMMPPFTIGVRATSIGDYDIGPVNAPLNVPEDLALDCVSSVRINNVDLALSYNLQVDHGFAQCLMLMTGSIDKYPVIPIHVNCAAPPLSPFSRIRALGDAVGKWAASLNKRVLVMGSGGLSHDPPIPMIADAPPELADKMINGHNPSPEERRRREQENFQAARELTRGEGPSIELNPEWDVTFMKNMASGNLGCFDNVSDAEITRLGGCGGGEVRGWVAAYSALAASGPYTNRHIYYRDISEWNAGMGMAAADPK